MRVRLSRAATLDLRAIIKHTERSALSIWPVEPSEVVDAIINSEWNRIVNGWGIGEPITEADDLYWMHEDGSKHDAGGPYDCLVCRRLRAGSPLGVVASRRGKPKAKTKKRSQARGARQAR